MSTPNITTVLKGVSDIVHDIRCKLYPLTLPGVKGQFIARTNNERALSVEEVCQSLKNRGGFTGDYEDLVDSVRQYFNEAAYLLCDGYAVNSGFFTIYPNIGGTFDSIKGVADKEKHPLTFRVRIGAALKALAKQVRVTIDGFADTNGYIHQFYDIFSDTFNDTISGSDQFVLTGDKIKVVGDDDECGVYFEDTQDPSVRIKVQRRLAENLPSKIVGITPMLMAPKSYRVVVVTRYSTSSKTPLKAPRTIRSSFELDIA